jgi:hypothetical protein
MNNEHKLTDREMAIEGYGTDYKGVLPDGTVTGVMSYNGSVFKHYVKSGKDTWRHKYWERDYEMTPLWYALETLGDGSSNAEMRTAECYYKGVQYSDQPMESVGLSGWKYDYHDKRRFRRLVMQGKVKLPAPAVFSKYHNIYIEAGHEAEVLDLYANWAETNANRWGTRSKTQNKAD